MKHIDGKENPMKLGTTFFALIVLCCSTITWGEQITLVTGEWPPYTSEKMTEQGMCSDIAQTVFKEMKKKCIIKFLPWKRCQYVINKGSAWAAFPYAITEERKKKISIFRSHWRGESLFFSSIKNDKKKITWEKLEDLKPFTIGGILGYFYEKPFKEAGLKAELVSDANMNFKKLKAGRIDFYPADLNWLQVPPLNRNFPKNFPCSINSTPH